MIIDASAIISFLSEEPSGARILQVTQGVTLLAPDSLPMEIGNSLVSMYKQKRIDSPKALALWRAFGHVPVRLIKIDYEEAMEIALQFNIYAYDAYVIEVARRHHQPLLTLDKKMARIARDLNLDVVEP